MRAVLVATLGAAIALAAAACGSGQSSQAYPINVYIDGTYVKSVGLGHPASFLPKVLTVHKGHGIDVIRVDPHVATRMVDSGLKQTRGRVDLPFTLVSSQVAINPQQAIFHHGSEVASLSMLLTVVGVDAGQPGIQDALPHSGPVDPQPVAGSKLFRWGDPESGFVGRPNGTGTHAFGVYEQPIRRLAAAKYGVRLIDFHGSVGALSKALLNGHPMIAWVDWTGSAARHSTWLTPSGKKITVNLGERAVVLIGSGPGYVLLNDPGTGREFKWSLSRFSTRWKLLGRRALELF